MARTTTKLSPLPRSGSASSLLTDISQPGMLTNEASLTCAPKTSGAIPNATSLQALAAGPELCASLDGPTIDLFGQAPVRVSRFRARDSGKAMKTNDTSGPLFTASSPSARLQSSLENRLRARTDVNGSPEYVLTWKTRDMPSGPPICALRASARPISGSGSIGWPTPSASGFEAKDPKRLLERRAECKVRTGNGNGFGLTLGQQVCLMQGWPTPAARDHFPAHKPEYIEAKMAEGHGMSNLNDVVQVRLQGWATPTAITDTGGAALCKWGGTGSRAKLREAVGDTMLNGALAPEFALWLMGFPIEWARCAERVTPLSRKSARNLSSLQKKQSAKLA